MFLAWKWRFCSKQIASQIVQINRNWDKRTQHIGTNVVERNRKQMSVARCASSSDNSYCTQIVDIKWARCERVRTNAHQKYTFVREIIFETFYFTSFLLISSVFKIVTNRIYTCGRFANDCTKRIVYLCVATTFKITCIYFVTIFFSPSQLFLLLCIHFACIGMTSIHDNDQEPQFLFLFFFIRTKRMTPKDNMIQSEMRKRPWKNETNKNCDINDSMPCCALVNRDKKMSQNFSCNQRRYDTNWMCRLLFCEINCALSHSFAHNERI